MKIAYVAVEGTPSETPIGDPIVNQDLYCTEPTPGPQGPKGDKGNKGDKGDQGEPGDITACWPVGSVFFLIPDTNPAEVLGFGTWAEVDQDKLPLHVWKRTE